jgi:MoxR-like ATPase
MTIPARDVVSRVRAALVGRTREAELVVAALLADRHVLLEGPPGTGKSTLLRQVAGSLGVGFRFVEGNAELTPARLVGAFDPSRVLQDGYRPEVFLDGPLLEAMRLGALLYVEEINRVPEETLNVLITVMSEGEVVVPRLGAVRAEPGFRLVAAMNPFDAVGTARISGAIYDRVCRVSMGYQSIEDECAIVGLALAGIESAPNDEWVSKMVEVVRRTRGHADLRVGSSVRGAIDAARVAASLSQLRGVECSDETTSMESALVALSGRVRLREGVSRTPDEVIEEIWRSVFVSAGELPSTGKARAPQGATSAPVKALRPTN